MIRHATRRDFGLWCLITAVGRIVSYVGSEGPYPCIHLGRVFRAALANCLLRFTVILMFKKDDGLVNDRCQRVIRRRVFVGQNCVQANDAVRGCEVRGVRTSGLVAGELGHAFNAFHFRLFPMVDRIGALATGRNFHDINGACRVRFRPIFCFRLFLLATSLFCRTASCHAGAASGRVRRLVFKRRR